MSDSAGERNGPATDAVRADSRHDGVHTPISGALCTEACATGNCGAICVKPEDHRRVGWDNRCACCVHAAIADASAAIAAAPTLCGLQCDAPGCGKPCVRTPHRRGRDWCAYHVSHVQLRPQVPVTPADFDRARQDAAPAAAPDLGARVEPPEAELAVATRANLVKDLLRVQVEAHALGKQLDELRATRAADQQDTVLGRRIRAILGNPGCALHLLAVDRAPTVTLETKWGELAFENENLDDGIEMAAQAAALRAPKRTPAGAR